MMSMFDGDELDAARFNRTDMNKDMKTIEQGRQDYERICKWVDKSFERLFIIQDMMMEREAEENSNQNA